MSISAKQWVEKKASAADVVFGIFLLGAVVAVCFWLVSHNITEVNVRIDRLQKHMDYMDRILGDHLWKEQEQFGSEG